TDQAGDADDADHAADCGGSIGIIAPITGDAAEQGQEQMNWGRLAVERFNEEHGTEIEVVEGDTQLDPAQASTVAQQFVSDDNIVAVVGPAASDEVTAIGPVLERVGMAFVSQSATRADLTTSGDFPTFYRVVPPDSVQAPTDAEYLVEELGVEEVLVVDDRTSYSTGLADGVIAELEDAGVSVATESVNQDQRDFSSVVAAIGDQTDAVFLPWQLAANAQQFGQQMDEQGKDAVIVGTDGLFSPGDFSIEGSVVSSFAPDITDIPEDAELVEAYRDEFGEFGTFGPPTFAAADVVLNAILAVCESGDEPSREAVAEQIAATDLAESILGQPIRFDENGDIEDARFFLFQVEDGDFTLIE
ncbi:MAG: branched-chain amino acid ABC transporter substrate-binding protein, partial [Egibacteraceae bacterium]